MMSTCQHESQNEGARMNENRLYMVAIPFSSLKPAFKKIPRKLAPECLDSVGVIFVV